MPQQSWLDMADEVTREREAELEAWCDFGGKTRIANGHKVMPGQRWTSEDGRARLVVRITGVARPSIDWRVPGEDHVRTVTWESWGDWARLSKATPLPRKA